MSVIRIPCFVHRAGVAAVVLALLVAACGGGEPDFVGTGDVQPAPLVGTEWQLLESSVGGSTTAVPAEVDAVVRFDGDGGWSAHGCNYIGGGVEIDGMHLSFDDEMSSTDMACDDPVGDIDTAVTSVLRGDVDAAIDGDELTLTGPGGDWLRLEVRDGIFPSRTMTPLDEGTRGEGDYRFGYEGGEGGPYVSWEFRAAPGRPWGFAGSGPPSDPHRPDPLGGAAEERVSFVFGVIGADVVRVVYEPPSGEPTELDLYPLGSDFPGWQAYGGFVEQPVAGSRVVTYDAVGAELGRSVDLSWP
jgi:heat shock protein HslJ